MSLRNNTSHLVRDEDRVLQPKTPHSLRWHLSFSYAILILVVLLISGILAFFFSSQSIDQAAAGALKAEAGAAQTNVRSVLLAHPTQSGSWPKPLTLKVIDTHSESENTLGIAVKVLDLQRQTLYETKSPQPLSSYVLPPEESFTAAIKGEFPADVIDIGPAKEKIRIHVEPIRQPQVNVKGETTGNGKVIGVLLTAKTLQAEERTKSTLAIWLGVSALVALAIAAIGMHFTTKRVLWPLSAIVQTARSIARSAHTGNLSQRVRRPASNDEMAEVVDTFNDMLDALEQATRAQRRFVADASHELRAPLTIIQGNLAFLQQHVHELPVEEQQTMLQDAHSETLRLARIVDELLLLARADTTGALPPDKESGKREKGKHPVEVERVLLQLVRQVRGGLHSEGSSLQLEVGHIEPVRVNGDEESVRRIMVILLDNAIKYTPEKDAVSGVPGKITVSLERKEQEGILHVKDTGIGIESEDLPHIFERFYRADRARTRQGTGLGLAIARTLTEQMQGKITVQSTPGIGTHFSVHFPLVD